MRSAFSAFVLTKTLRFFFFGRNLLETLCDVMVNKDFVFAL